MGLEERPGLEAGIRQVDLRVVLLAFLEVGAAAAVDAEGHGSEFAHDLILR